tara:strand:- start:742 stop:954 length:213 start_codon:yes stop_codon:yes gene_type:complete
VSQLFQNIKNAAQTEQRFFMSFNRRELRKRAVLCQHGPTEGQITFQLSLVFNIVFLINIDFYINFIKLIP